MVTLFYFFIYISNIIGLNCINSQNNFFISRIFQLLIPHNKYEKILKKYNINIQIIENKNITNEILINTSYIENIPFEFFYKGKFFYLTDHNLDLLSDKNENQILLIKSNNIFNNYISNNSSLIKYLTKVIIVPKNAIPNINIMSNYCFFQLNIYLLELDENIFNQIINNYIQNDNYYNNNNYYVKIISKKYEIFPFKELYSILLIFSLILFAFAFIYKYTLKKFEDDLKERQIIFLKDLQYYLNEKFTILFFLYIELNIFYSYEGFIMDYSSFIRLLTIFFMIINKTRITSFILDVYSGKGIIYKESYIIKIINYYLSALIILFYIFFQIFTSPLKIPLAFYFLSIFMYTPTFSVIILYSIKNFIFLFKAHSKIKKIKRFNDEYGGAIRLKICNVILQLFFYLIYIFFFFTLHEYLLFKKGICFEIEKDILFQCLDSYIILAIALIYIPRKFPKGFDLYILIIKDSIKSNKVQIFAENNYHSNIPKESFINEKEIIKFIRNNNKRHFSILNPKVFLDKEKDNKNISLLEKNIKIGKLLIP